MKMSRERLREQLRRFRAGEIDEEGMLGELLGALFRF